RVAIYDLSLNVIQQATLSQWWKVTGAISLSSQVIWDATTSRFYYAGGSTFSNSDHRLTFGFSKTAAPSNLTTDWCHYQSKRGSYFPDLPKLGDSRDFAVIGSNLFTASSQFVGAEIFAIRKPPAETACPTTSSLKTGRKVGLAINGIEYASPVPANEI